MESYYYYTEGEEGLIQHDYHEIVHAVSRGLISPDKKVLVYDPLWRDKKYVKAKNI